MPSPTQSNQIKPRKRKRKPRVPKGHDRCGWQGYRGEAAYEDAGCADGKIVDLDACDRPGGPCALTGEECPNCKGTGVVPKEQRTLGPMALIRQRIRDELREDVENLVDELAHGGRQECAAILNGKLDSVFTLINKLEMKDGLTGLPD